MISISAEERGWPFRKSRRKNVTGKTPERNTSCNQIRDLICCDLSLRRHLSSNSSLVLGKEGQGKLITSIQAGTPAGRDKGKKRRASKRRCKQEKIELGSAPESEVKCLTLTYEEMVAMHNEKQTIIGVPQLMAAMPGEQREEAVGDMKK
jgi:hypothetical protein